MMCLPQTSLHTMDIASLDLDPGISCSLVQFSTPKKVKLYQFYPHYYSIDPKHTSCLGEKLIIDMFSFALKKYKDVYIYITEMHGMTKKYIFLYHSSTCAQ